MDVDGIDVIPFSADVLGPPPDCSPPPFELCLRVKTPPAVGGLKRNGVEWEVGAISLNIQISIQII